jgi:hypothetical protein
VSKFMDNMTDPQQQVEKEVVIQAGTWANLKGEASLNEEVSGVREHAGQILDEYDDDNLFHKSQVENIIEDSNSIEDVKEEIL